MLGDEDAPFRARCDAQAAAFAAFGINNYFAKHFHLASTLPIFNCRFSIVNCQLRVFGVFPYVISREGVAAPNIEPAIGHGWMRPVLA